MILFVVCLKLIHRSLIISSVGGIGPTGYDSAASTPPPDFIGGERTALGGARGSDKGAQHYTRVIAFYSSECSGGIGGLAGYLGRGGAGAEGTGGLRGQGQGRNWRKEESVEGGVRGLGWGMGSESAGEGRGGWGVRA